MHSIQKEVTFFIIIISVLVTCCDFNLDFEDAKTKKSQPKQQSD